MGSSENSGTDNRRDTVAQQREIQRDIDKRDSRQSGKQREQQAIQAGMRE